MRKITCSIVLCTGLMITMAPASWAQSRLRATSGMAAATETTSGGIVEWIQKLSGPSFFGVGVNISRGFGGKSPDPQPRPATFRLRASYIKSWAAHDSSKGVSDSASLRMDTYQATIEFTAYRALEVGGGVSLHRFHGDVDTFEHFSFPLYLQVHPLRRGPWAPVLGAGTRIFPKFEASDFQPLNVKVNRAGTELVLNVFTGLEYRF